MSSPLDEINTYISNKNNYSLKEQLIILDEIEKNLTDIPITYAPI